ncbi:MULTISPECIES: hypothetical protein [unclassified Actinoplanes]|uniref:hypothetical protein n=1 Tax=unclassified Actinoplanes TaxID=2626549 RepID=UPI0002E82E52|nr:MULTISPECIES: hypothetical protein [unclassified Actinoplanes]SLL99226.1 hypothetical protein ACSP50_2457 [Actinoplanes sp. SE50/110]
MWYGIWPGVVAADLVDLTPLATPPEDVARTSVALDRLQGGAASFYIRCYRHYRGAAASEPGGDPAPADPGRYTGRGRLIDLVACYRATAPDPAGYAEFVRRAVRDVAGWGGGKVQVGEELNVPAPLDGGFPGCFEAVAAGVAAGLDERDRLGAAVAIGVNGAGVADPAFWARMTGALGPVSTARLDFVGLDMFPDVFRPIPEDDIGAGVRFLVRTLRRVTRDAGISGRTPLHVTETGWPTGRARDEAKQARVLRAVAEAVLATGEVSVYELFSLRDGISDGGWQNGFGLLRDDYRPKPAYDVVRRLIATS